MKERQTQEASVSIRIDKWLWFARFVKTRVIAQELATSGHVRINGQRVTSASRQVRLGDVLTIALPSRVRVVKVLDVAERRGPASDAVVLYEEVGSR
ncbi:MAG: RNA-binding S4 domain-containing protein [Beijerinckiaceae bacterium]